MLTSLDTLYPARGCKLLRVNICRTLYFFLSNTMFFYFSKYFEFNPKVFYFDFCIWTFCVYICVAPYFLCSILRRGLKVQDIVRGLKSEQIFPKYSKNLLSDFPACINLLLFRRTCYYLPRIFSSLLGSSPFEHLIPIIFPFFFLFSSFFFLLAKQKELSLSHWPTSKIHVPSSSKVHTEANSCADPPVT